MDPEGRIQPEQTLGTTKAFDGKLVRVRVDAVQLANGREAVREVVEHGASVVVIPMDRDGNVMLVRQYRYPAGQSMLEAPAGHVEESEPPDDCAQRELQEEIGYLSRDLRPLGGFWMSPGYCTEYMYAFLAKDLVPSKRDADEDEDIRIETMPLPRVGKLIRWGEIQDAKTIAAIHMATCLLAEG